MRYVQPVEQHSVRTTPHVVTYLFLVVDQPLKDIIVHRLYHWYDMRVPVKVPGWRLVCKLLDRVGAEPVMFMPASHRTREKPRFRDRLLEWDIAQDLRCFELSERNRTVLAEIEVTEDIYRQKVTRWRASR